MFHASTKLTLSGAFVLLTAAVAGSPCLFAQNETTTKAIPAVLADQFSYTSEGKLQLNRDGEILVDSTVPDPYVLSQMSGSPTGTATGIALDFQNPMLNGTVAYGTYNEGARYPTIFFLPRPVEMKQGKPCSRSPRRSTATPMTSLTSKQPARVSLVFG